MVLFYCLAQVWGSQLTLSVWSPACKFSYHTVSEKSDEELTEKSVLAVQQDRQWAQILPKLWNLDSPWKNYSKKSGLRNCFRHWEFLQTLNFGCIYWGGGSFFVVVQVCCSKLVQPCLLWCKYAVLKCFL